MDPAGLGVTDKKVKITSGIVSLRDMPGVTETFGDSGVKKQDIFSLARNAMNDPCMASGPRQPPFKDIERTYDEAR
jgi:alcohol dehydrogenase